MTYKIIPVSNDPPLPVPPPLPRTRRGRYRAIIALVLLGVLPVFAVGLLAGGLVESEHVRPMLITLAAMSCTCFCSLGLGVFAGRLHAETRSGLQQLTLVTAERAREAGYAIGYVDGRLGRPPRDGGPSHLRPVQ